MCACVSTSIPKSHTVFIWTYFFLFSLVYWALWCFWNLLLLVLCEVNRSSGSTHKFAVATNIVIRSSLCGPFFFSFVAISTEKFYSSQSIKQLKKCIRINLSSIMIIWRVSEKRKRRFLSCLELSQSQTSFLLFNLCGAARMYYNRWDN